MNGRATLKNLDHYLRAIWLEFFNNRDWPMASAVTVILLLLLVVPIVLFQSRSKA